MSSDLENIGGVTEKNPHMRVASPSEFGVFAYEADVVLIERDEDIACGEMIGYPIGCQCCSVSVGRLSRRATGWSSSS